MGGRTTWMLAASAGLAVVVLLGCGGSAGAGAPAARSVRCSRIVGQTSDIASVLRSARAGATVCLRTGSYPQLEIAGVRRSRYVTLRPAPRARVQVAGMKVRDSSFLRFEGLLMREGFNLRDEDGDEPSHDLQVLANRVEGARYGVVVAGDAVPIRRVLIKGNRLRDIDYPGSECTPGYADGQGVTVEYGEGIVISHNTFQSISEHYVQGGSSGALGMRVDHNLFEGPIPADKLSCTHLNVWQIFSGGAHDSFTSNIVRGRPGAPAAINAILFETGPGGEDCSDRMSDTTIADNLFVEDSSGYSLQLMTTAGLRVTDNTVVGSGYGAWVGRSDTCGAGSGYQVLRNIVVANHGTTPALQMGECAGPCSFDLNVTDDGSAAAHGSRRHVARWRPRFRNRVSFQPLGLPLAAGYRGDGGP